PATPRRRGQPRGCSCAGMHGNARRGDSHAETGLGRSAARPRRGIGNFESGFPAMNWTLLQNSLLVGLLTALLSVCIGFLTSLWVASVGARWRRGVLLIGAVALALPPFLVANCWMHLLGLTGVWRGWLPFDIYSLGGT